MRWLRINFRVPPALEDEVAVCLHEEGTVGIESKPGLALAYFPQDADADAIQRRLRHALAEIPGAEEIALESAELVEDGNWHERWVAGLRPILAGETFLIVPGPVAPPEASGRLVVRLTPGRAFGTGEHVTTRLCLAMMETAGLAGSTFLDVGTGSGILAIAARLSGASHAVALDVDPEAARVARRNAELNRIDGIHLMAGTISALRGGRFDIVAANVNGPTLVRSIREIAPKAGRSLILSGILIEEAAEVIAAAREAGMQVVERRDEGDWTGLRLVPAGEAGR